MIICVCAFRSGNKCFCRALEKGTDARSRKSKIDAVETNLVLTVFGKDNYMNYFQGALTPDKIVYIDKKQGQKLERLAERQLFGNYSSLDPNCIIHQPQCIYKLKEMEGIDRARSLTNKVLETRDSCESLVNQRNVVEHDSHEERI